MKVDCTIYDNRQFYYRLIKDFLDRKIKAYVFRNKFMHQRNKDIDSNNQTGFSKCYASKELTKDEQRYVEEYCDKIYNYAPTDDVSEILNECVEGAKKHGIKGPLIFGAIFSDIFVDIRDFWPRNLKEAETAGWENSMDELGFPELSEDEYKEGYYINEEQLRKKMKEKLKILEENKGMWM